MTGFVESRVTEASRGSRVAVSVFRSSQSDSLRACSLGRREDPTQREPPDRVRRLRRAESGRSSALSLSLSLSLSLCFLVPSLRPTFVRLASRGELERDRPGLPLWIASSFSRTALPAPLPVPTASCVADAKKRAAVPRKRLSVKVEWSSDMAMATGKGGAGVRLGGERVEKSWARAWSLGEGCKMRGSRGGEGDENRVVPAAGPGGARAREGNRRLGPHLQPNHRPSHERKQRRRRQRRAFSSYERRTRTRYGVHAIGEGKGEEGGGR